jgi:pyruvate/2-oxoglutarate/acetoin dehydrogenase E1 component
MSRLTYTRAIAAAQAEEMRRDPRVFLVGTDVQTKLFGDPAAAAEFGRARIRNAPISEAGITGAAAGAAMVGMRPIVNLSIASFVYVAADQIINTLAKTQYIYGGQTEMPVVVRCQMYYGLSAAAQHSDRPYPMFMGMPGLIIVTPSTPYDAKGLLKAAIRSNDPVLVFEDATCAGVKGEVPDEDYTIEFGVADVKRRGSDVTVVAIAGAVHPALAAAEALAEQGVSVEVIDPRTLAPLDLDTILSSAARTGRLVVVDPAFRTCSAASEIAAAAAETIFVSLKAPIIRVTTPDVHIPFNRDLEMSLYPDTAKIIEAVSRCMNDTVEVQHAR